jgi:hypothetical protein
VTLHEIVTETEHVTCVCGAPLDQPCTPGGVHYARLAHARRAQLITAADFGQAIHDADVFTGMSVLLDPEAVGL